MRLLMPNIDYTETTEKHSWIEQRYSHRYYCRKQMKNIDTDGPIKKCPQCDSSDLLLLEARDGLSKFQRTKSKIFNRIVKSYVKNRWPAKKGMDRLVEVKRMFTGQN